MGRRTTFTPEIGAKICRHLAAGMSLAEVSRLPGMPPVTTLSDWAWNPKHSDPDFVGDYARAREDAADTLADRICELAERVEKGELDAHAGRTAIDALKWVAAKLKPTVYGDRQQLELGGSLTVESPKDLAPEWLRELLAEQAPTAISAGDQDDGTIH